MSTHERPRVLCVDQDARTLGSITPYLREDYDIHTAASGKEALELLRHIGGAAVIVTDVRMPGMDGATLLQHVREIYPTTTRILFSADEVREATRLAINKGGVFRFLLKPCAPDEFRAAIVAGVEQHRLWRAERALLHDTLLGCIGALVHTLAITNPVAFERADRIRRLAAEFAAELECGNFWQLETAALLSQFGHISLKPELVQKLYSGARLSAREQALAAGVPHIGVKLLDHIPSLEPVMRILTALSATDEQIARLGNGMTGLAARILGLVLEYDALTAQGHDPDVAMQSLRARGSRFGSRLIGQFARHLGSCPAASEICEMTLRQVRPGMTLLQEVRTDVGTLTLLVPRGCKVTPTLLERLSTLGPKVLAEQVRVLVPAAGTSLSRSS